MIKISKKLIVCALGILAVLVLQIAIFTPTETNACADSNPCGGISSFHPANDNGANVGFNHPTTNVGTSTFNTSSETGANVSFNHPTVNTGTTSFNSSNDNGSNVSFNHETAILYPPPQPVTYVASQPIIYQTQQVNRVVSSTTISRKVVSVKHTTVAKKKVVTQPPQLLSCINPATANNGSVDNSSLTGNALFGANGFLSLTLTQWFLLLFLILLVIYLWKRTYSAKNRQPPIQHSLS